MKLSLFDYDPRTSETLPTVYGTIELTGGVLSFGGPNTARARQLYERAMQTTCLKLTKKTVTDQEVMTWLSKSSPVAANGRVRIDEP